MVKVIGDEKEYEFKKVKVKDYKLCVSDKEYEEHDFYSKDKEEKPKHSDFECKLCGKEFEKFEEAVKCCSHKNSEVFLVPKEIRFVQYFNCSLGLLVGEKHLMLTSRNNINDWEFRVFPHYFKEIDCVLVPIKREELKAGDWVCGCFNKDPEQEKYDLDSYVIWLGDDRVVGVLIEESINDVKEKSYREVNVREYESNELNWFRVVKKGELK